MFDNSSHLTKDNTALQDSRISESSTTDSVDKLMRELELARSEGEQLRSELNDKNDQIYRDYLTIETLRSKLSEPTQITKQETFNPLVKSETTGKKRLNKNAVKRGGTKIIDIFSTTNSKTNYHILERHGDTEEMMQLKVTFCEGLHKLLTEFTHHWKSSNIIFDHLRPSENGKVKKKDLLSTLRHHGILSDDPRITFTVNRLEDMPDELTRIHLSTALRGQKMKPNMNLEFITKAINNELLIPQFAEFEKEIAGIFEKCRDNRSGANADYIPELAKCPADNWGLAICTVEGQRIKMGHSNYEFSIQSCSKPINYAVAMEHLGVDKVH